jgi:hypothetical protein
MPTKEFKVAPVLNPRGYARDHLTAPKVAKQYSG